MIFLKVRRLRVMGVFWILKPPDWKLETDCANVCLAIDFDSCFLQIYCDSKF